MALDGLAEFAGTAIDGRTGGVEQAGFGKVERADLLISGGELDLDGRHHENLVGRHHGVGMVARMDLLEDYDVLAFVGIDSPGLEIHRVAVIGQ